MQDFQVHYRLQHWAYVLFALGLVGDSAIGLLLLAGARPQLLLLHIPVVLLWALGVNLIDTQGSQQEQTIRIGRIHLNRWGAAALLLSWCTFPGFGPLAYSIALFIAKFLRPRATIEMPDATTSTPEIASPLDLEVQPLIEVLAEAGLEKKRTTVAVLRRQANPETIQLLRQLLSDSQAEIRSDASIALTCLEDKFASALNASLEQWTADPTNREHALNLADQYYHYACSNLLDEGSQHFYLAKAHDLLQQFITQDSMNAELCIRLARIHQRLGETTEALQDVRTALQLQPNSSEAHLLGMEIAFSLHAWDIFISLARQALPPLPAASEARVSLQWWVTLHAEQRRGASYG